MRSLLAGRSTSVLEEHKWTIMTPAPGLAWFTSDDPVIRLNYYGDGAYDFGGGTGKNGAEILFPLSPKCLMYTRIGYNSPKRGTAFSRSHTELIRRIIAEHAFRYIYAQLPDNDIPTLRPRVVDNERYQREQTYWNTWHSSQLAAENDLLAGDDQPSDWNANSK
jgi:hypothetical protein